MSDLQTAHGFRDHISKNRYQIMRQPVVCARSGKHLHHEWLVRFDSPDELQGILRPAEMSGAIADLDIAMLTEATKCLNENPDRDSIALNLSGASFDIEGFESALFSALDTLRSPPQKLIFELTETWNLKDLEPAKQVLNRLRERGHDLCLDDIGAGAASLRYLRAFPANWLKIDGQFLADAAKNKRDEAVLKAVLGLREDLGVRFIAEGIETQFLHDYAKTLGIDALQGYFLGAPEPEFKHQTIVTH